MTPLLEVNGLAIDHVEQGRRRPLVTDVSFTVGRGETVGLVGESGSGKSLTARSLVSLLQPELRAEGSIRFDGDELVRSDGRVSSRVRGRDIGLLMQDPFTMLNPVRTAGHHLVETLRVSKVGAGLRGDAMRAEVVRRLAEVGIDRPSVADRYPFELSGGMLQRVALACVLASNPRLLVADEPTTALDATTQREILGLLGRIQRDRGMSLLLITHDLRLAFASCARVLVMYAGTLVESSPAELIRTAPAHPYSQGLLDAVPATDRYQQTLEGIPGRVPPVSEVLDRCGFASRCQYVADVCTAARPELRLVAPDQWSACVRYDELRDELRQTTEGGSSERRAAQARPALMSISELSKVYGSGDEQHSALAGVDMTLHSGEALGVVGESGSGKTTLARCVLGLTTPTGGRIVLDGLDVSDYRRLGSADAARARRIVQCVFQDPYSSLNPMHSVGYALAEALSFRVPRLPRGEVEREVRALLERVGLPAAYASRRPAALSGGQRQRVAVARALAVQPQVLVCDEPVAALDVSIQAQVLALLREVNEQGTALLFITHDLGVVRQVTSRVVVLYRGSIVEQGATDAVLDAPQDDYTRRLVASMPRPDGTWQPAGSQSHGPDPT
jgi:peptide/nickel transport system ATP-binding protein